MNETRPPATERLTVPLRLLAIADFGLATEEGRPPLHRVDKAGFADLLAAQAPSLEVRLPDHLSGAGAGKSAPREVTREVTRELTWHLRFDSLGAFHPDALVKAVPELRQLLAVRQRLAAGLRGEGDRASLLEELAETLGQGPLGAGGTAERLRQAGTGGEPAGASDDPVSSLLSKVEAPGKAPGTSAQSAKSLAELLAGAALPAKGTPAGGGEDRRRLQAMLAEVDRRLTRQVTALCQHPAVRDLEAAWRGLKLMVDRTDFRQPVQLEILSAGRDEALERFFGDVFYTEYEGRSQTPLSAVLLGYEYDRSPGDLESLEQAARMGESLRVPFLGAVSPGYWGLRQARLLARMPDLLGKVRGAEYVKWNRFRSQEHSLWLALAVNRPLLRDAWGAESTPVKSFAWTPEGESPGEPLWGAAGWALGAAVLQGFCTSGIRLPLAGARSAGVLEDLPLRPYADGKEEPAPSPVEVRFTERQAFELAESGFAPLVSRAGGVTANFSSVPTFHAPTRYDQQEATRDSYLKATLPYQLFAALASHALQREAASYQGSSQEELKEAVTRRLQAFLATAGHDEESESESGDSSNGAEPPPEVAVELAPNEEHPRLLDVHARLQPRFKIYGGAVDLLLGTTVEL